MNPFTLFFIICAFQSALIYYQHFTPFERENNWLSVRWGAQATPRLWAVGLLDLSTGLLFYSLILAVLPAPMNDVLPESMKVSATARFLRVLPMWVLTSLLVTLWPFPIEKLKTVLPHAKRIVVVEASNGQLEDEVKLALANAGIRDYPEIEHVRHFGGVLPQMEEVILKVAAGQEVTV